MTTQDRRRIHPRPGHGAKGAYGDFLVNAQGEDVVAGIRNTEPIAELKDSSRPSMVSSWRSSRASRPTISTCATPSSPSTRQVVDAPDPRRQAHGCGRSPDGRRHGAPSDLAITKAEAVSRITEDHLDSVLHPQFAGSGYSVWPRGRGQSGAAVGRIYFTADDAAAAPSAASRSCWCAARLPEDVHGMLASEGILTARADLVSHAAVVARGWQAAVVGAEALRLTPTRSVLANKTLHEGDWVSLDGVRASWWPVRCRSPQLRRPRLLPPS